MTGEYSTGIRGSGGDLGHAWEKMLVQGDQGVATSDQRRKKDS